MEVNQMITTTIIAFVVSFLVPVYFARKRLQVSKRVLDILIILYSVFIIYEVLLKRSPQKEQLINLTPFWTYGYLHKVDTLCQLLLNILIFIPLGILLSMRGRKAYTCILVGFALSVTVEAAQYYYRLGLCEYDDVFHNTLGTTIGCLHWRALTKHVHHSMKRNRSETQVALLHALKDAFSGKPTGNLPDDVLQEAASQTVLPLICSTTKAYPTISNNVQLMWEQQELGKVLDGIPYLVIKGSCASIYYPEPLRRTLGDIDILVKPEYFTEAYRALEQAGYDTEDPLEGNDRHMNFERNGLTIELHRRYAVLQTKAQEAILDGWLYEATPVIGTIGKYSFPMPENQLNGLVLLAHINQHLEEGLGLRHLVDWVMYVRHSLDDAAWPAFKEKSDQIGLTKLAKAVAKFGQMYLGLSTEITWCADMQESTVEDLLDYIFECGNFGHKDSHNNTIVMVMSHGRGLKGFFRNLQKRGEANWEALKTHSWLRPFAWIYQGCRYIKLGIKAGSIQHLMQNKADSNSRNKLMDELGATRFALKK